MAERRRPKPKAAPRNTSRAKKAQARGKPARRKGKPRRPAVIDIDAETAEFLESILQPPPTHRFKPEDLPDPRQWHSELPEFQARPLTKHDHQQVLQCVKLIAPVEATGMTVLARMELAAAFMASACTSAYNSASAQGDA